MIKGPKHVAYIKAGILTVCVRCQRHQGTQLETPDLLCLQTHH